MTCLIVTALAFVGTHFLLSHPLRAPLVERLGERPFQGVYSLVALATFAAMIWCYRGLGDQAPEWSASEWVWTGATVLMWFASVLLVGSFIGNPALPGAPAAAAPRGVLGITRHPMMWSFALWAVVHAILIATPKVLILDAAILILALGGAAGQDHKKARLTGEAWHSWVGQTAFFPFARGLRSPGLIATVGGTLLFLLATWLHPMPVGVWRWFG